MFLKLFKYDFLSVIKKLVFYFIAVLGLAVFSKIIVLIFKNSEFSIIAFFPSMSYLLSIYIGTLVPIILCMIRYYKNMLSDEGYLTHTLPVNKSSILLSKILVTLVMELLTIFVIIISLMIYSFESIPHIAESVLELIRNFDPSYIGSVYGIIALCLVEVVCAAVFQVTQVAMCLTLGAMHNKSKLVMAFVYYIAINFAIQVFVGVVAAIITIIGLHIEEFHIGYAYLVLSFVILVTLIGIGLTYFVNLMCLKKRLNLE